MSRPAPPSVSQRPSGNCVALWPGCTAGCGARRLASRLATTAPDGAPVAWTTPTVATLAEAVELELYYRSVEAGRPILTRVEKDDLVEFLNSLGSPSPAAAPKGVNP